MRIAAALAIAFLLAHTGAAEQRFALGPLTLLEEQAVRAELYNASSTTVAGTIELFDFRTGLLLDHAPVALPGERGTTVGFSQSRVFNGEALGLSPAKSQVVFSVITFETNPGAVWLGAARRGTVHIPISKGDEHVLEFTNAEPVTLSAPATVRAAILGGAGSALVELVRSGDGAVLASATVQEDRERKAPGNTIKQLVIAQMDAAPSAFVVRLTPLSADADLDISLSIEPAGDGPVSQWRLTQAMPTK